MHGYEVVSLDIAHAPFPDLRRAACQKVVLSWVTRGWVRAMWVAFPCSTWSIARRPALRSMSEPLGRACFAADAWLQEQIKSGNITLQFAVRRVLFGAV